MKLTKISLKDFRGFPVEETFDLADGKNLLLYGENGSGKSSLFRAIVEFFNLDPKARSFGWNRNIFSSGADKSALDGHVTLEFDDGNRYQWRCLGNRPHADPRQPKEIRERLTDAAGRLSFLEYRSLLRTTFGVANVRERLFELAVTTLLANVPVSVAGGKEKTVGQLWRELLESKPYRHTKWQVRRVTDAERAFNLGLAGVLPDVERKVTKFLAYFAGSDLELKLSLPGVRYDGSARLNRDRKFTRLELHCEVKLHGVVVEEWNDLLNEARLSALALSLYLAGAHLGNPAPPPSVGSPLRLLLLDDVLLGLDLANRRPVIDLIEREFVPSGWQVLLLTFDRAWYEVARQSIRSGNWLYKELFAVRVGDCEKPVLLSDEDHLYRALAFFEAGQVKAAAVHVRTKFEQILKWACHELGLKVRYHLEPHTVAAAELWAAVRSAKYRATSTRKSFSDPAGRLRTRKQPLPRDERVVPAALASRVELAVSWILNPLNHSQTVECYRREIEDAIYAVDELEAAIRRALDPLSPALPVLRQMLVHRLSQRIYALSYASATPVPPSDPTTLYARER